MAQRILIVDDDTTIRRTVAEVLERQGYEVRQAESGDAAVDLTRKHVFDLILLDLRLPDSDGIEVMKRIREFDDYVLVVVMTAYPEVRTAINALKAGAYDYLNKPFDIDDLKGLVQRALETQQLRTEVERLRVTSRGTDGDGGMIGESSAFLTMVEMMRKIAGASRVPVLIRGESGTGKERVAQAIHANSPRSNGPWITVNCSAISEGLLESEMFGHEKGAFTDAKTRKRGLLELADGGTLFLDEIGDLSLSLQPKLLRALETQTFRRVGGQVEVTVDVRFVTATNRDLNAMVGKGQFREDLYYRLNVAGIDVPPLRDRRPDIVPLALSFIAQGAQVMGLAKPRLGRAVVDLLESYNWPGNVRELRNVMERAVILSGGGETILPIHLPKELLAPGSIAVLPFGAEEPKGTLADTERRHILRMIEFCGGNKSRAARLLGISRLTLRTKLGQYGLDTDGTAGADER
ncbi:MAG: hypothetical protein A3G18_03500 [Rhodospirillales bacterium RIFCSPLOWO2_12_FULL_58_28]|nr:MAG: hypothetical protein A3H92_01120 [Rhodospirillales bacterium RIFCSPLOWO2_02_FULL_58_16]OHC76833.1 MAG: hypothetical protein A3G18_03500 [Rhodospirillales bacterium RIFCSPLOWO2_12_FULL_58_28]